MTAEKKAKHKPQSKKKKQSQSKASEPVLPEAEYRPVTEEVGPPLEHDNNGRRRQALREIDCVVYVGGWVGAVCCVVSALYFF